jgi:hypothetical protein
MKNTIHTEARVVPLAHLALGLDQVLVQAQAIQSRFLAHIQVRAQAQVLAQARVLAQAGAQINLDLKFKLEPKIELESKIGF